MVLTNEKRHAHPPRTAAYRLSCTRADKPYSPDNLSLSKAIPWERGRNLLSSGSGRDSTVSGVSRPGQDASRVNEPVAASKVVHT